MGFLEDCEASRLIGGISSSGFGSEYSIWGIEMRRIRFRDVKKSKIRKCSESNSGRPKIWSKSGQNDPGTLIIGFALKNYAQKWSQIEKWLDGCPQNDDFGIFARSLRTLLEMSMIPGLAWERLEKRSSEVSRGPPETYPPPCLAEAIAGGSHLHPDRCGSSGWNFLDDETLQ